MEVWRMAVGVKWRPLDTKAGEKDTFGSTSAVAVVTLGSGDRDLSIFFFFLERLVTNRGDSCGGRVKEGAQISAIA